MGGRMQETKSKNTLEIEAEFMSEYWEFRKKYYRGGDWPGVHEDSKKLADKYHNLYVELMLTLCIADIEARNTGKAVHLEHMIDVIRRTYGSKN